MSVSDETIHLCLSYLPCGCPTTSDVLTSRLVSLEDVNVTFRHSYNFSFIKMPQTIQNMKGAGLEPPTMSLVKKLCHNISFFVFLMFLSLTFLKQPNSFHTAVPLLYMQLFCLNQDGLLQPSSGIP